MRTNSTTLYKYVPLTYVDDILRNQRLYLSDGKNFNDPFEVTVTDHLTNKVQYIEGLHILSLTNGFENRLIWSHYGDSHKGICLSVEVPAHLVYPICYTKERLYSDSDVDAIIERNIKWGKKNLEKSFSPMPLNKKRAYIKDHEWAYENEYRIVFDKNDEPGLIKEGRNWYMSVKIKNVYWGVNFDNDSIVGKGLVQLCNEKKITTTRMVLADRGYTVKSEGIKKHRHSNA